MEEQNETLIDFLNRQSKEDLIKAILYEDEHSFTADGLYSDCIVFLYKKDKQKKLKEN